MPDLEISRARHLLFSLIPVTVILLAAEVTLRLQGFHFSPEALRVEYSKDGSVRMFQHHLSSRHFVRDPVTIWKPKPSEPPFNSLGYRGEELPEAKAEGEYRILAVGDSNTVGHESSWVNEIPPSIDCRRLGFDKVTVINAGVYGYTSYQGKHHLRRFLRYRPDLVVISFGGNDPSPNSVADKDYVPYRRPPIFAWLGGHVAILDFVEALAFRRSLSRSGVREPVSRVSPDDYRSNLVEMIRLVRQAGAEAVLATRPMVYNYHEVGSSSPMKPYYASTWRVAKEQEVGLIDVDAMADHSWVLFADHAHFNVRGHEFIGAAVAQALTRIVEGRARVASAPKFEPRDAFETATDVVGRTVSRWRSLDENLDRLRRSPAVRALTTAYRSDFATGAGDWGVILRPRKHRGERPEIVDGALCFEPGPAGISLRHETLDLAADGHHMIWMEAVTRSDVTLAIAGSDAAVEDSAVENLYYGGKTDVPIRFFRVLPAGVRTVRIEVHVLRWVDAFCVRRIHFVAIDTSRGEWASHRG